MAEEYDNQQGLPVVEAQEKYADEVYGGKRLLVSVDPFAEDTTAVLDQNGFLGTDPVYQHEVEGVREPMGDPIAPPASGVTEEEIEKDDNLTEEEVQEQSSVPVIPQPTPITTDQTTAGVETTIAETDPEADSNS